MLFQLLCEELGNKIINIIKRELDKKDIFYNHLKFSDLG